VVRGVAAGRRQCRWPAVQARRRGTRLGCGAVWEHAVCPAHALDSRQARSTRNCHRKLKKKLKPPPVFS